MKVSCIYHDFPHHSKFSGYSRFVPFVENQPVQAGSLAERIRSIGIDNFRSLPGFSTHHTNEIYFPLEVEQAVQCSTGEESRIQNLADQQLVDYIKGVAGGGSRFPVRRRTVRLKDRQVYHFLYGHLSYRYFNMFPVQENVRTVISLHEPPDIIAKWKYLDYLKRADAIAVVARAQIKPLRKIFGHRNIFLAQHGIDTGFFSPAEHVQPNETFTTVSVGHWLRDIPALIKTIETLRERKIHCIHKIITFSKYHHLFADFDNVELYSGITDQQLRDTYRSADCLLLPLEYATANNAVLESMACGLPIVSTAVGGVREYTGRKCAFLGRKGSVADLVRYIEILHQDPDKRNRMSIHARKRAARFEWSRVASQYLEIYRKA
jgi:glycosyltransferase involved in cell wall biosynthesis